MNLKKFFAVLSAAAVILGSFTACGDNDGPAPLVSGDNIPEETSPAVTDETPAEDGEAKPLLSIDGEEVDTDGLVMMTINGVEVPFDEWRYMYKYVDSAAYSSDTPSYWEDFPERFEEMLGVIDDQLLESHWGVLLAKENNISLTDEDREEIETHLQEQRDMFETEEAYEQALEQSSITEDLLKRLIEQQVICNRVYEELYNKEGAPKVPSDEEIKADIDENYVRVYHVLVSNDHFADDEAYAGKSEDELKEAARAYAEELLAQLQDGADIYEMAQSADDPGMIDNPDGYFFTYDYMVKPFEEASFALEVDELSGIVETDYGFHIIKRLEQEQFLEDNWDEMKASYVNGVFNKDVDELLQNAVVEHWENYDKIVPGSVN